MVWNYQFSIFDYQFFFGSFHKPNPLIYGYAVTLELC
jgi:hypothetical protein